MADEPYDPYEHQTQNNNRSGRHKSPMERSRKSRSRSRSPRDRDWKKSERRQDRDHGRSSRGHGMREKDAKVRLYVSNIPYDIRWQDLKDVFREKVGNVVTFVEIYESPEGKSVGAGVIEIRGADNALKAIELLHKTQINGRSIIVREEREKDRMRHQKMMRMDEMGDGNGILGPGIGAGMGGNMGGGGGGNMGMGNWGMGGGGMGPSGGMGVGTGGGGINMGGGMALGNVGGMGMGTMMGNMAASPVSNMGGVTGGGMANSAVSSINPQVLQQLGIDPNCVTDQVFVANLDYNVTESKLKEVFRMAGRIIDAEIRYDKEGKSRGIGLVKYEYPMEAVQAISMFNGQMLFDRMMSVRMDKLADQPNQQMPAKLPSGLMSIGMGLGAGGTPIRVEETVSVASMGGMGGVANLGGAGMGGVGSNLPAGLGSIGGTGMGTGMAAGMAAGIGGGLAMNMAGAGSAGNFGSQDVALGGGLTSSFGNRSGGRMSGGGGMDNLVGMDNGILGSYTGNMGGGMGSVGMQHSSRSEGRSRATDSVQVRNIPFSMSWQNLRDKFNDVGDVRYAEIQMTADGRSKGVGVVRFHSPEDARRAVNLMHGLRIDGRQIDVRLEK